MSSGYWYRDFETEQQQQIASCVNCKREEDKSINNDDFCSIKFVEASSTDVKRRKLKHLRTNSRVPFTHKLCQECNNYLTSTLESTSTDFSVAWPSFVWSML